MAEGKKRSALFKFFYVILRIVTFPIYMVIFLVRHPLWVLFFLLLLVGAVAYYPYSLGVKPDEIVNWYKAKYIDIEKVVVARAEEKGITQFVPQGMIDDVKKMKEDEIEAQEPKGENYNAGVIRDEKSEETKVNLKKRRGFKKTGEASVADTETQTIEKENTEEQEEQEGQKESISEEDNLGVSAVSSGGLAAILKNKKKDVVSEPDGLNSESNSAADSMDKEDEKVDVIEPMSVTDVDNSEVEEEKVSDEKASGTDEKASGTDKNANEEDLELEF